MRKTSHLEGRLPQKSPFLRVTCKNLGRLPHFSREVSKRNRHPYHPKHNERSVTPKEKSIKSPPQPPPTTLLLLRTPSQPHFRQEKSTHTTPQRRFRGFLPYKTIVFDSTSNYTKHLTADSCHNTIIRFAGVRLLHTHIFVPRFSSLPHQHFHTIPFAILPMNRE